MTHVRATINSASPDALDGPVAAPDHHRVVFENDRVRVVETLVPAGQVTPVHTHLAPTVLYLLAGTSFIRRAPDGSVLLDTSKLDPPSALASVSWWDGNPAHTLENTGPDDIHVIGVELKG